MASPDNGDSAMTRSHRAVSVAVFSAALLLYGVTAAPTISYGGDCGELIAAAHNLGISHPTGYPVYMMLGKLFSLLPLGELARRYNLFSALCGAAAVLVLFCAARALTGDLTASALAAASLAVTVALWAQAVIAEVYTLNALTAAAVVFSYLRWRQTGDARWILFVGLLFGLSLGIHLTTTLWVPAFVLAFVLPRKHSSPRIWLAFAAFFLLAAANVLYLPIRAAVKPAFVWSDRLPLGFRGLFDYLTAHQYQKLLFAGVGPLGSALSYVRLATVDLGGMTGFAVVGLLALIGKRPAIGWLFAACVAVLGGFAATYSQPDNYTFLLPAMILAGLFCAEGLTWMRLRFANATGLLRNPRFITAVGCFFILLQLPNNLPASSMWGNRRAERDVDEVVRSAPQGAMIVVPASDQMLFTLWYNIYGLARRTPKDLIVTGNRNFRQLLHLYGRKHAVGSMYPPRDVPPGYQFVPGAPFGTFGLLVPLDEAGRELQRACRQPPASWRVPAPRAALRGVAFSRGWLRRESMCTAQLLFRKLDYQPSAFGLVLLYVRQEEATQCMRPAGTFRWPAGLRVSAPEFVWADYHCIAGKRWSQGQPVFTFVPRRVYPGAYQVWGMTLPVRKVLDKFGLEADEIPEGEPYVRLGTLNVYVR